MTAVPPSRDIGSILAWLRRHGSRRNRDGMARYGIRSPKVFGVSMATMRPLVTQLGRDHDLALALWDTGWLEARILQGRLASRTRLRGPRRASGPTAS